MARIRWPGILFLFAAVLALAGLDACRHGRGEAVSAATGKAAVPSGSGLS